MNHGLSRIKFVLIVPLLLLIAGCGPMTPQQQAAWQNFGQNLNENSQRELDRQAYGRQPSILYMPQQNQNYWQEQAAREQYFRELNRQRNEMFKLPYNQDAWKPLPRMNFNP